MCVCIECPRVTRDPWFALIPASLADLPRSHETDESSNTRDLNHASIVVYLRTFNDGGRYWLLFAYIAVDCSGQLEILETFS